MCACLNSSSWCCPPRGYLQPGSSEHTDCPSPPAWERMGPWSECCPIWWALSPHLVTPAAETAVIWAPPGSYNVAGQAWNTAPAIAWRPLSWCRFVCDHEPGNSAHPGWPWCYHSGQEQCPSALDEGGAPVGWGQGPLVTIVITFFPLLIDGSGWVGGCGLAGKWSWPCAARHRPHAICEVGEAGQCHLVVLAIQHYMAGQFDPVVRGSVRSWMVLLGHGVDCGGRDHLCATLARHLGHLIVAAWWWWSCSGIMMMLWQSPTTLLFQAHLTMYCHLPLQHQVSRMPPVKLVQQYHLLQFQPVEGSIDRLAWHGSHHIGHKASTQKSPWTNNLWNHRPWPSAHPGPVPEREPLSPKVWAMVIAASAGTPKCTPLWSSYYPKVPWWWRCDRWCCRYTTGPAGHA